MEREQRGWLVGARHVPSPNYDDRPEGEDVSLVVIHGMSLPPGEYGGAWIDALFTNSLDVNAHPFFAEIAGLKVSSHFLIRRDGELVQYVSLDKRAWHAGHSCFEGRLRCNDFSVGIELEGCGDELYEEAQYRQLATLLTWLMRRYPAISARRIVGHCDIAPGRKTDPGEAFDWARLVRDIGPLGRD